MLTRRRPKKTFTTSDTASIAFFFLPQWKPFNHFQGSTNFIWGVIGRNALIIWKNFTESHLQCHAVGKLQSGVGFGTLQAPSNVRPITIS